MKTVLVWILIMHSWDGGMVKVENIATWEDCERMRQRVTHSALDRRQSAAATVSGACTQVGILVPATTTPQIVVHVPPQPAPVVNNRVIIRKAP